MSTQKHLGSSVFTANVFVASVQLEVWLCGFKASVSLQISLKSPQELLCKYKNRHTTLPDAFQLSAVIFEELCVMWSCWESTKPCRRQHTFCVSSVTIGSNHQVMALQQRNYRHKQVANLPSSDLIPKVLQEFAHPPAVAYHCMPENNWLSLSAPRSCSELLIEKQVRAVPSYVLFSIIIYVQY